ncbi:MAG: signal peptidase I [Eubacteriales bacterium]|nr:signal peptidase I [Eubacteriales bacterium]
MHDQEYRDYRQSEAEVRIRAAEAEAVPELEVVDGALEGQKKAERLNYKKEIRDWVLIVLAAVLLGLFLRNFVVQRNLVDGSSMFPTLHDSDRVLVEMLSLRFSELERGDIVTVDSTHLPTYEYLAASGQKGPRLIKRVIAGPGDHLEIRPDGVYVNGEAIFEQYVNPGALTRVFDPEYADVTLAPDCYYVMGDNREHSKDSRQFGPVHKKDIVGKLWIRLYPYSQIGKVE